jgi:tRNA nucleotidyltransferase/poly(A) polymerase
MSSHDGSPAWSWRAELMRRFPKLASVGAGSYVVGGAIRDLLAGREPADVDVASLDPLRAARGVRDRVIRLGGEEHLVAYRVVDRDRVYDFAEILDGDIGRDLARRDFTVNAMAVDLGRDVLLDPHDGRGDVAQRIVRMVRPSNFDDDPLRTLKAIRMAVRYDMSVDEATIEAIRSRAPRIGEVAAERVTYELAVIFAAGRLRRAIDLFRRSGLGAALAFRDVDSQADDVSVAAAYALLVEDPRAFAERWKWSDALLREVLTLQRLASGADRLALFDAGETIARQLPALLRAAGRSDTLDVPDFSMRPLLSGGEIGEVAALAPGKELGRIKRALVEEQVWGRVRTRDEAIAFVKSTASSKSAEPS